MKLLLALLFTSSVVVYCNKRLSIDKYRNLPFYESIQKLSLAFGELPDSVQQISGIHERFNEARKHYMSELTNKRTENIKQSDQVDVCPYSVGGYHVIVSSSYIAPDIGAVECAKHGWNYAIVPDNQWQLAAWAIANCTFLSTGVRSYNGFVTSGCQMMQSPGVFMVSLDPLECSELLEFPLVCQEGPLHVLTSTTTQDSTTTTTTIATIFTPMTTPEEKIMALEIPVRGWSSSIDKSDLANKRKKQFGEIINGYDVCTASINGLHIIYDAFNYEDSAQVCSDLGWNLADVDLGNIPDIMVLFDACQPFDVLFNVNSFAGITSGLCRIAYILPWYNVWGISAVNAGVCFFLTAPIICQESPITATALSGTASETTVTHTSTLLLPTATVTITETTIV